LFIETSTESKFIGAGPLKRFKKEPLPVGHIKIFNYDAISDLLKKERFKILKVKGAIYDSVFPRIILFIDNLFRIYPKLSADFVILSQK
jgi:hypothetical protein